MARPTILDAANAHIEWLASNGVPAALSRTDLVTPGVLITPPTWQPQFGSTRVDLAWTFYAVAADTVQGPALAELSDLLDKLADAYPGQWSQAAPATVDVDGAPLPAYRIVFTQRLQENQP